MYAAQATPATATSVTSVKATSSFFALVDLWPAHGFCVAGAGAGLETAAFDAADSPAPG
jgi:hypothetical protein